MARWAFSARRWLLLLGVLSLTGCARSDALWGVVDKLCMANYQQKRDPAPCEQIYMPQGKAQGFSVLQNPRYPYHFILVPTAPLSGIESPLLLAGERTDYFGYAWLMRYRLAAEYGGPVPDDSLGMAINSAYGRSQNQLHIHLTCLREDVRRQLQAERPYIQEQWRPLPDKLLRHTYYARRVMQPTAMGIYPIRILRIIFICRRRSWRSMAWPSSQPRLPANGVLSCWPRSAAGMSATAPR